MSDELSRYLSTGSTHASLSAERLESMGKEAANMLLDKKVPLNTSIPKLAAAVDDINGEQVKRICEFANTAVYLAQHDRNKTAGSESSYPQFELADPNRVIQDLSSGSKPTRISQVDLDYGRQHEKAKLSSKRPELEDALQALFIPDQEKTASVLDFSRETGVHELMTAKGNLVSMKEHLESAAENYDLLQKQAAAEYYHEVKTHLLTGESFSDVLMAANSSGLEGEKIAAVLAPVIEQLLREKVASDAVLSRGVTDLEKVAHRIVNEEHPLVRLVGAVAHFDEELSKCAEALASVDSQLVEVRSTIKETFLA
jgi:hypothetical protein